MLGLKDFLQNLTNAWQSCTPNRDENEKCSVRCYKYDYKGGRYIIEWECGIGARILSDTQKLQTLEGFLDSL